MKTTNLLFALALLLFFSCSKDNDNQVKEYSVTGVAQKGPFTIGSEVSLYELNDKLGQTGKSYTSTITSNLGEFKLSNAELSNATCLVKASGYYYHEIIGDNTPDLLMLKAYADLTEKGHVNINVLTHIACGRIETLIEGGMDFESAKQQAAAELLSFFNIIDDDISDFETMEISGNQAKDVVLLAISLVVQRYTSDYSERQRLAAELQSLLSSMSTDFSDGEMDNREIIDTLMHNISRMNYHDIRKNMQKFFPDAPMPGFEPIISKFQEKHAGKIYADFTFPGEAIPFLEASGSKRPNLLFPGDSVYAATNYTLAAITPLNGLLKIELELNGTYFLTNISGWQQTAREGNVLLISQRHNQLMTGLIYLEGTGTGKISYYYNDTITVDHVKNISW